MIRIRQIKIDIKKDSREYLKNKVASILDVDVSSIEDIELKKDQLTQDTKIEFILYMKLMFL